MIRRYALRRLLKRDLPAFFRLLGRYGGRRLLLLAKLAAAACVRGGILLEAAKNWLVQTLLWKRGALRKPVVHFGMVSLVSAILVLSGATFGSSGLIATTYPGVPSDLSFPEDTWATAAEPAESLGLAVSLETIESEKPRDRIVKYRVKPGDTVSTIAEKFGIDVATIQWANPSLANINDIMPGDTLDIMPVSGVAHRVEAGDTIYSIAEEYGLVDEETKQINAQPILNWPFNDIGEDLSIKVGQILIVPGGVKKEEAPWVPPTVRAPAPPAPPPPSSAHQGLFAWPFAGGCSASQWPVWYHMAIDCTNPIGTPIAAAGNGVVSLVQALGWGYGYHVIIDHGDGLQTLYAHMSGFNVKVGDRVSQGQTIGWVGLTGRTTGPHLHFEVRKGGAPVNPLNYLP
jgi:murein DD-endopeptidase MepM/ murein hydrolase activator NlpD